MVDNTKKNILEYYCIIIVGGIIMNDSSREKRLPSEEMKWTKYYNKEYNVKDIPNKSIYQYAYENNKDNMNKIAFDVRSSQDNFGAGIKLTYQNVFDRINDCAKASKIMGINNKDLVPIILPNVPEARILMYSNSILGSRTYQISPLSAVNNLRHIIDENKVKNLFIVSPLYDQFRKALQSSSIENIVLLNGSEFLPDNVEELKELKKVLSSGDKRIIKDNNKIIPWDEYLKSCNLIKDAIKPFYEENHVTAIIGTSGTTGTPKGVCLTDKELNAAALSYKNIDAFPGNMMDALIPSIGYGLVMLHYQMIDSKYVYLIPELLIDKFPDALYKLKPDNYPGGPVHYINLNNSIYNKNNTIPERKVYLSGGATLDIDVEKGLNKVGIGYSEEGKFNPNIVVRPGYALTEHLACAINIIGGYKFGSVGVPLPYTKIGIFKPNTDEELGYFEEGEVCVSGPATMECYLNNVEETNKIIKIHKDGRRWVHTQDIGFLDTDGHLFFVERIKDIFMRTGFNVHPRKISEFINSINYVKNSAVIGFEHPEEQEVPVAFIELNNSLDKYSNLEVLERDIYKECVENLEATSVPYKIVFVDEIPINRGGKIDKKLIKEKSNIDFTKEKNIKKVLIIKK